jgi:RimJ/RimL family protein N-acetyltransferase
MTNLADGVHVMVGGIDAANAGSIRLHERFGFTRAARSRIAGIPHSKSRPCPTERRSDASKSRACSRLHRGS